MGNLDKVLKEALKKVANRIREKAIDEAPYITRALQKSITVDDRQTDRVIVWAGGGGAPYAPFVHEGTGIYGPLKRPYLVNRRQFRIK